jgi:hypothetical protein
VGSSVGRKSYLARARWGRAGGASLVAGVLRRCRRSQAYGLRTQRRRPAGCWVRTAPTGGAAGSGLVKPVRPAGEGLRQSSEPSQKKLLGSRKKRRFKVQGLDGRQAAGGSWLFSRIKAIPVLSTRKGGGEDRAAAAGLALYGTCYYGVRS